MPADSRTGGEFDGGTMIEAKVWPDTGLVMVTIRVMGPELPDAAEHMVKRLRPLASKIDYKQPRTVEIVLKPMKLSELTERLKQALPESSLDTRSSWPKSLGR